MGAFAFTYGTFDSSSDAGVNEVALNEFSVDDEIGRLRFSTDIFVQADTDAELNTRVTNIIDKLAVENLDFELNLGSETILDWDTTAYKAFDGKPTITKTGRRGSTSKGQFIRFVLNAKREPKGSGRNGRRSDMRVAVTYTTDELRSVEFSGTWTQTESGTSLALARYLASAESYFAASWLDAGQVLAPASGCVWQKVSTVVTPNDTNREARYITRYRETEFSSTPGNTDDLIYTIGTFTRLDPPTFGAELGGGGDAGEPSPVDDHTTAPAGGGGTTTVSPLVSYKRFAVQTTSFVTARGADLNTLWEGTIRPWIAASVKAIFGNTRVIFEGPGVPVEDVAGKRINCTTNIIQAGAGSLILHEERLEGNNDPRRTAEVVYDGRPDSFDVNEGGRMYMVTHVVTEERLDQAPVSPTYLGSPWLFWGETNSLMGEIIDPITDQVAKYRSSVSRQYLYAPNTPASRVVAPAPLGQPGGGGGGAGGAVTTPGGDSNGVSPL